MDSKFFSDHLIELMLIYVFSVITGVRFNENSKVIFLQIQIGKLLPWGSIDKDTVYWQSLPSYINGQYLEFGYDVNLFSLGNIAVSNNQTISGFMFQQYGKSVGYKVFAKEIVDLALGELDEEENVYTELGVDTTFYGNGKTPGLSSTKSTYTKQMVGKVYFGKSGQYVDAGQSFLPYFDGNDVEFDVKIPLAEIGFFQYTQISSDYAGYIKPFIGSIKFENYI